VGTIGTSLAVSYLPKGKGAINFGNSISNLLSGLWSQKIKMPNQNLRILPMKAQMKFIHKEGAGMECSSFLMKIPF
jgi:hypothetical protein